MSHQMSSGLQTHHMHHLRGHPTAMSPPLTQNPQGFGGSGLPPPLRKCSPSAWWHLGGPSPPASQLLGTCCPLRLFIWEALGLPFSSKSKAGKAELAARWQQVSGKGHADRGPLLFSARQARPHSSETPGTAKRQPPWFAYLGQGCISRGPWGGCSGLGGSP